MAGDRKKHTVLFVFLAILLLILFSAGGCVLWFSYNYKQILHKRLPAMIAKGSDSIYHMSFTDVDISLYHRTVTLTNVRFWPDSNKANELRQQGHYSPNTTSAFVIPRLEASGISWKNIFSGNRTVQCSNLVVYGIDWFMETKKHQNDMSMVMEKASKPFISRFTILTTEFVKPHLTYHYVGKTILNNCAFDHDPKKDTSTFLFATDGSVRPDSFEFKKDGHMHYVRNPNVDFVSGPASVTLKHVSMKPLTDFDDIKGHDVIRYNLNFPAIELVNFNWQKLISNDVLACSDVIAPEPLIDIRYFRDNAPEKSRTGDYPNQLLRQAIKTNIRALHVKNERIKYTEPVTKNNEEGTIEFTKLNATFTNIVNIDSLVAKNNNCRVKVETKFMNKSPINIVFDLSLTDPKGHFSMTGTVKDLGGEEVTKQAEAFTIAKVTSFHLSHMDMHVEGNESSADGHFTMLYQDLKISLFKFKSNERKGKTGPLSFLADLLILYPSNPMPGKEVRTVSTSFVRNPKEGFFTLIWKNIYRGAKKTAVRSDALVNATDGPETGKDAEPKKLGFFKRLFGRRNKRDD
jgi:hypothetical protein